jgi:GGDEF domain-containing protein
MSNLTWNDITTAPEWSNLPPDQRASVRNKFYSDVIQPNIPDGVDPSGVQAQFAARTADSMKSNVGYGASIYRAVAGGLSDTDQFARKLGAVPAITYDDLKSRFTGTPTTAAQDAYFGNVVQPAVQYGASQDIDPATEKQSTGARIAGGLVRTGTDIGQMMLTGGESAIPRLEAGGAELIGNSFAHAAQANLIPGTRNAGDRAQQILDQGGTGTQAAIGAGADFLSSTVGNAVPLGVASDAGNVVTRFGVRAATAAPVGALSTIANNDVTNWTNANGQRRNLSLGDLAEGAAQSALLGGVMGERKSAPLSHGDDLQTSQDNVTPASEDPATHVITPAQPVDTSTAAMIDPDNRALAAHTARVADLAQQLNLDPDQAQAVTQHLAPTSARDPVTGFYTAPELTPTLQAAQAHVAATGEPARYAELDVRNLGGLNSAVGHTQADAVLRDLAQSTHKELQDAGAQVVPVRRGGDEYGFVIQGGDRDDVQTALDNATAKADEIAKAYGVDSIPHPKGDAPGVGIVTAHEPIVPGQNLGEMFRNIDSKIESQKGNLNHGNEQTNENGLGPTDGSAATTEPSNARLEPNGPSVGSAREGLPETAQTVSTGAAENSEGAAPAVTSLPAGLAISDPDANGNVRVSGPTNQQYAPLLKSLGARVGANARGEQQWTLPAAKESSLRDALAPHAEAEQVQAAGMPTPNDAIEAANKAIANRTSTGALHDFLMKVAPMAAGTDESRAIAKDFSNAQRLARFEGSQADKALTSKFSHEQLARMWDAANEHGELEQQGLPTDGRGLNKLNPAERAAVDKLQTDARTTFEEAKQHGLVADDAEGISSYTPRMMVRMTVDGAQRFATKEGADSIGSRLRTTTANLLRRKHLLASDTEAAAKAHDADAELVRNIRTLPLATTRLREAIAGRKLINAVKAIGEKHGTETVAEGRDPSKADQRWFTMPENAAFYTSRPKTVQTSMREAFDQHLWDGLHGLAAKLGVDPKRVAAMRGGRWGEASPLDGVTTRFGGPESVLTHELGHIMDFKYGLADQLARRGATAAELRALADLRYEGRNASDSFKQYVRKGTEKIANMVHAYVHTPERFREVAPKTYDAFTKFLDQHPELSDLKKLKPSLVLGSRSQDVPVTQWERVPLYMRGDFEGPLRAVLGEKDGAMYRGLMDLKQKVTGLVMYSPLIHNAVEWGRALPAMPGKVATFRIYFDGNKAKNDPATMREAINAGLSPIGGHGAFNDVTSIADAPHIQPGRSWTAKLLAYVPGLFDKDAGDSVKRFVDKAGDVWHNTLLWDRVADLQMGLYTGLRDNMLAKGMNARGAQIVAAHMANRYAGTLPKEAMSSAAQKIANLTLFSRTFTLGNLGAMKDALTGLPKDAQAQILRDAGAATLHGALKFAKRKALATVMLDIGLMYATNSLLQSSIAIMRGDSTLDKETQGYLSRLSAEMQKIKENPLELLHAPAAISATSQNEPGKQDRVLVGHAADGTAIYMRNPVGKIGEEFQGWLTGPLDMIKKKLSTFAQPTLQTLSNDKGFGQKVYDDTDDTTGATARRLGRIAMLYIGAQLPTQAIQGAVDYFRGKGDATLNAARVLSPLAGVTFSKGAPGGPAVGEMYQAKSQQEYRVQQAMPDIRAKIQSGNVRAASQDMTALGIDPKYQEWIVKTTLNPALRLSPHGIQELMRTSTPDARARMQNDMQSRAQ